MAKPIPTPTESCRRRTEIEASLSDGSVLLTRHGPGAAVGVGVEGAPMSFGHEQLDVYRVVIEYVAWAYRLCEELQGHRNARDQLLPASQAIPLTIAEGNGKATRGDRHRSFDIGRGSALECGARLSQKQARAAKARPAEDVLEACGAVSPQVSVGGKQLLDRIVAMLTKLGRRGDAVGQEAPAYRTRAINPDPGRA